jgi:hypothetical protein
MKKCLPLTAASSQGERFPVEMHRRLYLSGFAGISFEFQEQRRMIVCVARERKIFRILSHKLGHKHRSAAYRSGLKGELTKQGCLVAMQRAIAWRVGGKKGGRDLAELEQQQLQVSSPSWNERDSSTK